MPPKTAYKILQQTGQDERGRPEYAVVGHLDAHSAEAAIRAHAKTLADEGLATGDLVLVATPARSWNPVHVAAVRQVSLVFSPHDPAAQLRQTLDAAAR